MRGGAPFRPSHQNVSHVVSQDSSPGMVWWYIESNMPLWSPGFPAGGGGGVKGTGPNDLGLMVIQTGYQYETYSPNNKSHYVSWCKETRGVQGSESPHSPQVQAECDRRRAGKSMLQAGTGGRSWSHTGKRPESV